MITSWDPIQLGAYASCAYGLVVCGCVGTRIVAEEQLPPQQVAVEADESLIEVAEEVAVLVLHLQFLGRVPVDYLHPKSKTDLNSRGNYRGEIVAGRFIMEATCKDIPSTSRASSTIR